MSTRGAIYALLLLAIQYPCLELVDVRDVAIVEFSFPRALQSEFLSQCFERVCDTYLSKLVWTESIATVHGISHDSLLNFFTQKRVDFHQKTLMLKKLLSFPNPWLIYESHSLMPLNHCHSILSTVQPHQYEQGL